MFIKFFILVILTQYLQANLTLDYESINYETILNSDYLNQNRHVIVLVLGSSPLDKNKVQILNEFKNSIEQINQNEALSIKVHSINDDKFARKYSIIRYPSLLFIRDNRHVLFKGDFKSGTLLEWAETYKEKKTVNLDDSNFEHDTQASSGATTGDWFVLFYKSECKVSMLIESTWEQASLRPDNRVIFSYVNIDRSPHLKERFNIMNSPTLLFFRQGLMYRYEIGKYDVESLISFSSTWYINVKSHRVPLEKSWFDRTIDTIVRFLKKQDINFTYVFIGMATTILLFLIIFLVCFRRGKTTSRVDKRINKFD